MALKVCTHITKFKREKFTKPLTSNGQMECNFQHIANTNQDSDSKSNFSICSDCGIIGCSTAFLSKGSTSCIEKHCLSSKHFIKVDLNDGSAYCYKCEISQNELIIELRDDDKQCNNPLTEKLENYLDTVKDLIHKYRQRVLKKTADHVEKNVLLENPYKDDWGDKFKTTEEYLADKNPQERNKKKGKGKNSKAKQIVYPSHIFGLENEGNTCYMAVVLQCLNGDKKIADFYINNYEYFQSNSDIARQSFQFSTFQINSRKSKTNLGTANDIFNYIYSQGLNEKGEQGDAQIFYYILIDGLIEESKLLDKSFPENEKLNTFLDNHISFKMLSYIKCLQCDTEKFKTDRNVTLSIALDEKTIKNASTKKMSKRDKRRAKNKPPALFDIDQEEAIANPTKKCELNFNVLDDLKDTGLDDDKFCDTVASWEKESCTNELKGYRFIESKNIHLPQIKYTKSDIVEYGSLNSLLKMYFGLEVLKNNNSYKCETCIEQNDSKVMTNAIKSSFFSTLGDSLVINLKIYQMLSSNDDETNFAKVNSVIKFSLDSLDLTKYAVSTGDVYQSVIYELYAVVQHKGSINSGHFMCVVRHEVDKNNTKWVLLNDSNIQEITEEEVQQKQPYIQFYRRKNES